MTLDLAKLRAETLPDRLRGIYRIPITDGLGPAGGEEPYNPDVFVRRFDTPPIQHEAADEIERLTAENERMRADCDQGAKDYCDLMEHRDRQHVQIAKLKAALRPFVEYVHDDLRRGSATYELVEADRHGGGLIGADDLRRARAALAEGGPDDRVS